MHAPYSPQNLLITFCYCLRLNVHDEQCLFKYRSKFAVGEGVRRSRNILRNCFSFTCTPNDDRIYANHRCWQPVNVALKAMYRHWIRRQSLKRVHVSAHVRSPSCSYSKVNDDAPVAIDLDDVFKFRIGDHGHSIDVKNFFYVFYSCHVFYVF